MELTPELGEKIINETSKLINENIIIVNRKAIIIASTDLARIGNFHEGALITIQNNSITILTEEHVTVMKGIRPGINLPISIDNLVIGVIGITGNPTEILPFASLMQRMTELLIRESIYIQETEWHARALEAYFFDWVQMKNISEEFQHRGELLGIKLSPPLRCTLMIIDQNNMQNQFMNDVLKLLHLKINGPAIRWGNNRILLLTEDHKDNSIEKLRLQLYSFQNYISSKMHLNLSIGIGTKTSTYQIKDSYLNAEKALTNGKEHSITCFDDLLLEVCLDDVRREVRDNFTKRIVSKFNQEEYLVHTLRTFLTNNMNLKRTANELHIHINTLHYRLNRVEQLTGLNPKKTYSIALFYSLFYFLDKNTK